MNPVSRKLVLSACFTLATPVLFAQQPGAAAGPGFGRPQQNRAEGPGGMHRRDPEAMDAREERQDEMQDLDELGLPFGDFWLDPQIVQLAQITPDQVRRLSDVNLQGRLKVIQLDATLQMEQARLDAMLDADPVDAKAALTATDRVADARAAVEKADAHLAFDLRAVLTADQIGKLRETRMHGMMGGRRGMGEGGPMPPRRPGQGPYGQPNGQGQTPNGQQPPAVPATNQ